MTRILVKLRRGAATGIRGTNCIEALPGECAGTRSSGRRLLAVMRSGQEGQAIVETAFVALLLLMVLTGIFQFGLVFTNLIALTQAATIGAQVLQTDRLSASDDPCKDVFDAITGTAPTLAQSNISLYITMGGTPENNKTSCPGAQTNLVQGTTVSVQITYPYTLTIVGYSSTPGTLNSGTISEVEY